MYARLPLLRVGSAITTRSNLGPRGAMGADDDQITPASADPQARLSPGGHAAKTAGPTDGESDPRMEEPPPRTLQQM